MSKFSENCLPDLRLVQALDGELPAAEAWRAQLHVETCESCRARLDGLRSVSSGVTELHQVALPPEVTERFAARLAEEESEQHLEPGWRGWLTRPVPLPARLAWCGALTILILGGLILWTTRPHPGTVVRPVAGKQQPAMAAAPREFVNDIPAPRLRRPRHSAKRSVRQEHVASQTPAVAREIVTPFFTLPFSDAALPLDEATMIRVELPRSALELAGLPVDEDRRNQRVRADLILGVDGLARAIRFVE